MKKILLFLLLCFSITLWAANKEKILTAEQEQADVERHHGQERCGVSKAINFVSFSTYFPFGWVEDISEPGERVRLDTKGVFETVFRDILKKIYVGTKFCKI